MMENIRIIPGTGSDIIKPSPGLLACDGRGMGYFILHTSSTIHTRWVGSFLRRWSCQKRGIIRTHGQDITWICCATAALSVMSNG